MCLSMCSHEWVCVHTLHAFSFVSYLRLLCTNTHIYTRVWWGYGKESLAAVPEGRGWKSKGSQQENASNREPTATCEQKSKKSATLPFILYVPTKAPNVSESGCVTTENQILQLKPMEKYQGTRNNWINDRSYQYWIAKNTGVTEKQGRHEGRGIIWIP